MYKESDEGGIVISFRLALPAGPSFRGPSTTVNVLTDAKGLSGLEMLPKVESPNHEALL